MLRGSYTKDTLSQREGTHMQNFCPWISSLSAEARGQSTEGMVLQSRVPDYQVKGLEFNPQY
jgi:hypothetical protein